MPCLHFVHSLLSRFLCTNRIANRIWSILSDVFNTFNDFCQEIVHYVKMSQLFNINYVHGSVKSAVQTGLVNNFLDFLLSLQLSALTITTPYFHISTRVYMNIYTSTPFML